MTGSRGDVQGLQKAVWSAIRSVGAQSVVEEPHASKAAAAERRKQADELLAEAKRLRSTAQQLLDAALRIEETAKKLTDESSGR